MRVAAKSGASEDDVASLGDMVAGHGGVRESDMRKVEGRYRGCRRNASRMQALT